MVIVGGGPAGLECARILSTSTLKVLLLEKRDHFGDKLCAGGLTLKDMGVLRIPDHVIEYGISRASIHSRKRRADTVAPEPYLFTVNRMQLGAYQRGLLEGSKVEVMTGSQVTGILPDRIVVRNGMEYGYRYLVGAGGYGCIVRRYLKLPNRKKLIGFQYTLPEKEVDPVLHIFLDSERFHFWYAWIFPHRNSLAVGCCCDPRRVDHQIVKARLLEWMKEKDLDPGVSPLESYPIAYDYQGFRFGNLFLAGEAAGLASGFTGEGIYQSLTSGQEVARIIMDPEYEPQLLNGVLKYNRILERVMALFRLAGPLRGALQETLVYLMNRRWIRDRINAGFS